jgi:hypothetical protein
MRRERIAELEMHQAARQQGFASLADVEAIVLESDGTFSVLGQGASDRSTLASVPDFRPAGGDASGGDGSQQQQRTKGSDRSVEG